MNDTDKDEENVNTVEDGENQKVDEEDEEEDEKEIEEERESEGDAGGRAWKVSRYTNGRLSYVHIKRALKLLLPRECRQKRHWASKYLPGKEQENPKHDIFKYCDIALKVTQDGKRKYRIGRVEAMESTKDGSEVISFQLKSKATVQIQFSMYQREDDIYFVPADVLLSDWKSQSSIIGTVNMQPTPGKRGSFTLHPSCNESLQKLGISPFNADDCNSPTEDEQVDPSTSLIDDEFYEVDDVLIDDCLKMHIVMNTRYGSKATAPKMICGYPHPSLIDRFTLALPLNLEERGNIPSTRTMSSNEAKEQSGVLARIAEVMLPDLTGGK